MSEQNTDKYTQVIEASAVTTSDEAVAAAVQKILDEHFAENNTKEVHTFLFNTIDLTTLKSTDSPSSVARFTQSVNDFEERFPPCPTWLPYACTPTLPAWCARYSRYRR